ncbi:MAG: flagellar hook-basal body complex protein FliE [Oceanospirillaceae bacterium]|nr:flagellar hook-basal body complex protein FliE [Oceanospirillaceae bacterium]MBT10907.1 flagellar hook-basal body complex protein FliE [Oceanospirillaceae bacterium]
MMVDRVDINSVLMQMRQVKSQLREQQPAAINTETRTGLADKVQKLSEQQATEAITGDNSVPDFQTMFKNAIDTVNTHQKTSAELATRFEQGDPSVDLPEVMIAMQKSSVSFQAMTQVRNKLVEAYKEVMNMPV